MVKFLCELCNVSRSGYYNYFSDKSKSNRNNKEIIDHYYAELITKAIKHKNIKNKRSKGARQIKMVLENDFNINLNLKKIRRLMKKFSIKCVIRTKSPYKMMIRATQEHTVLPYLINREFKRGVPGLILLTDITYIPFKGNFIYLSTILDASTNEIVAYEVQDNLRMPLVLNTIEKLKKNKNIILSKDTIINSDQGSHYTSPMFINEVKKLGIKQSMSRKGNCWDNAPQESFFGHFKDDLDISECKTLDEAKKTISNEIKYHNGFRYQWGLDRMSPSQYRIKLSNNTQLVN
jgi:transposase InsO family protein